MKDSIDAGYAARYGGWELKDNPYVGIPEQDGEEICFDWDQGWRKADKEINEKMMKMKAREKARKK